MAEPLFRADSQGKRFLTTNRLVIAQLVWTLESFYKLENPDIGAKVETILNTPNLICPETALILPALDLCVQYNIDFTDAYHAVTLKRINIPEF